MKTDYRPIDCGLHSRYERYVIEGVLLHARWRDAQDVHETVCRACDLFTRDGEEFIVLETAPDQRCTVRLDHILSLTPLAVYAQ